jgi:xanthine dehydrogenase small subunit
MRNSVRFLRNGRIVEIDDFAPSALLLDYLRITEGATGTKEGCSEGDCGACTVAVGRMRDGELVYEPVNACIQILGGLDGTDIVAVEDIGGTGGGLHPVQEKLVEKHGSQCGFCTPGFVMTLFTLFHATDGPVDRRTVNDWLAGNLCRCTGYRPIVDAAMEAMSGSRQDRHTQIADVTVARLNAIADDEDIFIGYESRFFAAPASIDSLAVLYQHHPDAVLVAGGTDVGLWITKQLRDLPKIIHLGRVRDLDRIEETKHELLIGPTVTYAAVERQIGAVDPDLGELFRRLGARQVRACGTIGGNIANGSPIGDTPPALIALGASIELRRGTQLRVMSLEEYFIDYGKQNRQPGEFLTGILIPKPQPGDVYRCYKISKRFDQDISSVMGAFRFTVEDGAITDARIAYGGMAGIPKRALYTEASLRGTRVADGQAWTRAFEALREDYAPIDDHRATAKYRAETAQALLGKALIEAAGTKSLRTRVIGHREQELHAAE